MATVMREQNEPERVVAAIIIAVSRMMSWSGGAHLAQIPGTTSLGVRERWGLPIVTRMLGRTAEADPDRSRLGGGQGLEGTGDLDARLSAAPDLRRTLPVAGHRHAGRVPGADLRRAQERPLGAAVLLAGRDSAPTPFLSQVADILSRTLSLYLQRKAAEKRLVHASLHDALTGLPNRVYLTEQLQQRLAAKEPASVLYVDLDRYKVINDTLGHQVGDQVLIEVARRFRESIGPNDVAGRIGGDEFILLLDHEDNKDAHRGDWRARSWPRSSGPSSCRTAPTSSPPASAWRSRRRTAPTPAC